MGAGLTELCVVCRKYAVHRGYRGGTRSNTCSVGCSRIRNTCSSDKQAFDKWYAVHHLDHLFDWFNLGIPYK